VSRLPRSRRLASLEVSPLGIGCVGMSNIYGAADESESAAAIRCGLDAGITVLDTADSYGPPAQPEGHNESLVGRAIAGRRADVTIVTKVGISLDSDFLPRVDARPDVIRRNCDESLQRLGIDAVDLYLLHRVDPQVPVEESVGAMAELVEAGKVKQIGLCEVTGQVLRQAAGVHPIAAIESEWSLWSRDIESTVLNDARELGVGILAYAPLGRGFLAGAIKSRRDLADRDLRSTLPRFQEEQIQRNLLRLTDMEKMAATLDCTLAQLALAWLLAQGDDVVPIPGMERVQFVRENLGALEVTLTTQDLERLDALFPVDGDYGERYNEGHARFSANSE
jgi:aryl-alcohol dehydrogenase-like predicted oxidoreductase